MLLSQNGRVSALAIGSRHKPDTKRPQLSLRLHCGTDEEALARRHRWGPIGKHELTEGLLLSHIGLIRAVVVETTASLQILKSSSAFAFTAAWTQTLRQGAACENLSANTTLQKVCSYHKRGELVL